MVNHNKWDSAWPNLLYVQNLHKIAAFDFKIAG